LKPLLAEADTPADADIDDDVTDIIDIITFFDAAFRHTY